MKLKTTILLILLPILLAGCTLPGALKNNQPAGSSPASPTAKQDAKQEGWSLKNALSLGQSVKCSYTTEQGEVTTWVKDKKVKVEGLGVSTTEKSGKGGMINDGEWIYIWNDADKSGMKYKLAALVTDEQKNESVDEWKNPEKWANDVEGKYKTTCGPEVLSDNAFVPPSDITFKDLTESFEKMKELQKNLPSIAPIPSFAPIPDETEQGSGE
jgi:hypothetical protein